MRDVGFGSLLDLRAKDDQGPGCKQFKAGGLADVAALPVTIGNATGWRIDGVINAGVGEAQSFAVWPSFVKRHWELDERIKLCCEFYIW